MIRRFEAEDAIGLSEVIQKTLHQSNLADYGADYINRLADKMTLEFLIRRAAEAHLYVVWQAGELIGCGGIGPFWGKDDESWITTVFVLPEYQGLGIGRQIIERLEQDEFFRRAKRIEVPASITACDFYRKFGYQHKAGKATIDSEGLYRLEKYNEPGGTN